MSSSSTAYLEAFATQASRGLYDSLSFDRTIPVIVNCRSVAESFGKCILANGILLIGSIMMFEYGIKPGISIMGVYFQVEETEAHITDSAQHLAYCFYHGLWILPIWGLCYVCSVMWYQDIADNTFKHLRGAPKTVDIKSTITSSLYGFLVWFFAFVELQLISALLPSFCDKFSFMISKLVSSHLSIPVYVLSYVIKFFGFVLASIMYGWYGFDATWICEGLKPNDRYKLVESNWSYLFGFGLPYAIIIKSTDFFLGYGLYLVLYPLCIISACVVDIKSRTKVNEDDGDIVQLFTENSSVKGTASGGGRGVKGGKRIVQMFSVPIFDLPQFVTSVLLGGIDKQYKYQDRYKKKQVKILKFK